MEANTALLAFNRGMVSRLALARLDIKRLRLSAEVQTNWMPRVMGSMMLRPGMGYAGSTLNNAAAKFLPFVFSTNDTALIELTENAMRVWVDDALISSPSVSTVTPNNTFAAVNTTCTFTGGASANIVYTGADIFADDDPIMFTNSGGALPSEISANVVYYVTAVTTGTNTITISATVNGTAITFAGVGTGTHTIHDAANVTGWTDNDEGSAVSMTYQGIGLALIGTGTNAAIRTSTAITVAPADQYTRHQLEIYVSRGICRVRIGTSAGGEEIVSDIVLRTGDHSIGFTPNAASIYVQFSNTSSDTAIVESAAFSTAANMQLYTPWLAADLQNIRHEQSGDVTFIACEGYSPMRIERQDDNQWSCVEYAPEDGPFRVMNTGPVTLTPSAITGAIILTASKSLFKSTNEGSLFKIASNGQQVAKSIATPSDDLYTDPIRVTGIDNGRVFSVIITGTFTGTTATLQRSVGEPGDWVDVTTYTAVTTTTYDDTLDNQIIYYRLGVKTGAIGTGSIVCNLSYAAGSISGVVKIFQYVGPTVVYADVLIDLGGTTASNDWAEGAWSDRRGWPTSVCIFDGRLWWAGGDHVWGSISDAYDSFDESMEGDAGPISRTIGSGPVDIINWLLPASNLIVGGEGAELVARSSSLDEPLTPTQFSLKPISSLGSTNVEAVKVDTSGVFVHRNRSRVYEMSFDPGLLNYSSHDLTAIIPEIGGTGISRIAVQRQPDTRIHFVRDDGKVAVLVYDKTENVTCWVLVETDGIVEDVVVLPGVEEDWVYYVVKRTINGATKRYLEVWAMESEAVGGTVNKMADSYVVYSGALSATIAGLGHLEGETVCVWGNSKDLGTYTVASGSIMISEAVTLAYIGLPYTAQFKSSKLALMYAHQGNETPLNQRSKIDHLGLVLADTHAQGIKYGPDFTNLDDLPLMESYVAVDVDSIWDEYNAETFEFNGEWTTDSRLCLQATAPRPVTVLAAIISGAGNTK